MKIEIFPSEKQDFRFYGIMGEHFASLEHKKEFGGWQVYNKPDSIWFLIYEESNIAGFCAYFKKTGHYFLENFMILKQYRRKGYSSLLLCESLKHIKSKIKTLTNNPIQMKVFEKFDFIKCGSKGSYNIYERF